MLVRASLIVAVLAGLAALGLSHFKVAEKIEKITTERDNYHNNLIATQSELSSTQTELDSTIAELEQTRQSLNTTSNELQITKSDLREQTSRANELNAELLTVTEQKNKAQEELAAWKALGIPPSQISQLQQDLKNARKTNEVYAAELEILEENTRQLEAKLRHYEMPSYVPDMPPMKGKIVSIDPKWKFVILNIGSDQGVVKNGELLVSREGNLIGKVKVTSVEPDRCIANIMEDWAQTNIVEGDIVLN
ncbi:MAG: hypothetical protein K9N48_03765 [Verrucomicrobia bacterium]|nr:hypothetical protein [Verrucomicrobiota bacterium]MCF7707461.1 hypothetical protein [Verrucomicrobiota bacterium]